MKALVVRKLESEKLPLGDKSATTTLEHPIRDEARRAEAATVARELRGDQEGQ